MIHIFTTGGTIEGLDYVDDKNSKSQPITTIDSFLKSSNISIDYTIENVFQKDSRHINDADRKLLLDKIEASNSQKILITHGTFTMEHTARFLGQMQLGKTIVLVGSFILGTLANTDAPFNLGYAISSLQFLKPDVYIAINGQVFHWKNVTKNLELNKFERNDK